jgi:hypothetical protein
MHMAAGNAAAAQRGGGGGDNDNGAELRSIRDVLNAIREDYATQAATVASLRAQQRLFYRVNQRFPQCIDVGIRVWERLQDWHIAHNRPLNIQRTSDGHWQMDFIMTVVVLKHEMAENDISLAYDR